MGPILRQPKTDYDVAHIINTKLEAYNAIVVTLLLMEQNSEVR